MTIISAGGAVVGAGGPSQYEIERSLRFNSADSAYLNRTPCWYRKTFGVRGLSVVLSVYSLCFRR
jgi:hypothetical protein